jgi:hypothetical protein
MAGATTQPEPALLTRTLHLLPCLSTNLAQHLNKAMRLQKPALQLRHELRVSVTKSLFDSCRLEMVVVRNG